MRIRFLLAATLMLGSLASFAPSHAANRPCAGQIDTQCWIRENNQERYCQVYLNTGVVPKSCNRVPAIPV